MIVPFVHNSTTKMREKREIISLKSKAYAYNVRICVNSVKGMVVSKKKKSGKCVSHKRGKKWP